MKLSATFLDAIRKKSERWFLQKENYLRYTKLTQGKPANFALLEQRPALLLACLGRNVDGSSMAH